MAQDHFERHNHYEGVVDWNFNVLLGDQPSVVAMAKAYEPIITRPEYYDVIPPQWLHSTIHRIGAMDEYTQAEMLAVAELVQVAVNDIRLPEMYFGPPKLIFGNICFAIKPEDQLEKLYTAVADSLQRVVGPERTAKPRYGKFLSHASLVYTRAQDYEADIQKTLDDADIEPVRFKITHMPLVRTWPIDGHYEWEIVKDIVIN